MRDFETFPPAIGNAPRFVDLPEVEAPTPPEAPVVEAEFPDAAKSILPQIAVEVLAERYPGTFEEGDTGDDTGDGFL